MRVTTTDDVLDLMDDCFTSAALVTALELGLFWLLEKGPVDDKTIAETFEIPINRCRYWLQLLNAAGFIEQGSEGYTLPDSIRAAILDSFSRDTWGLLAKEASDRFPGLCDLSLHINSIGSVWDVLGLTPSDYISNMTKDPQQARRFTHMLYELHQSLAEVLARSLNMTGVKRLLDLGGGSGVISQALLCQHPHLTAVVVDIPNVCAAGRVMAAGKSFEQRLTYHEADFLRDELPSGFDMVVECDVNVYNESLFRRVWSALKPEGRFIVVDQLAPAVGVAPASRIHWAFQGSMIDPEFTFLTSPDIQTLMKKAGFRILSQQPLPHSTERAERFMKGMTLIEAQK